jgi:hypothetical protein
VTDREQELPLGLGHVPDVTGHGVDAVCKLPQLVAPADVEPVPEIAPSNTRDARANGLDRAK